MPEPKLAGGSSVVVDGEPVWGTDVEIGPDVIIRCRRLTVGNNVKIGTLDAPDSFRYPGGVRIDVEELVLHDGVRIERHVLIRGGRIELGRGLSLEPNTTIHATRQLLVGAQGIIRANCMITGVDILIGRHYYMLPHATIGGGSAFEVHSRLRMGDFCHVGTRSFLNTARPITLGHEVGLGTGTCLYTHGAYPSVLDGKPAAFGPITVGDRTWIPGAIVNPSCHIGSDCIIGVGSVVTRDIPDGCLAAGAPARVLKEGAYPKPLTEAQLRSFLEEFLNTFAAVSLGREESYVVSEDSGLYTTIGRTQITYHRSWPPTRLRPRPEVKEAVFLTDHCPSDWSPVMEKATCIGLRDKKILGSATPLTERLLNQFRRYGIRFRYDAEDGEYRPWA